ncbi:hypothetical protein [Flavivirga jejuensis]|uniref:DUF4384 domain-containing protein n=1 Tax=Flavivirga jejuensis TaxID=870487 RepID=A0ABT8WPZ8_9FLAO|nr:hypothetical protein [Flavivirga jejuensis]MDO5975226.1 hypothetical protein [Flavivirga jejuensis]
MKNYILIVSLFWLSFSCNNFSKTAQSSNKNTKDLVDIKPEGDGLKQEAHYFAVNYIFTESKIEFISADKQEGELNYFLVSPIDLFLVAYKNGKLIYFTEFPDPLAKRTVGENETVQKLDEGYGTINFPETFSKPNKNITIYIFKVKNYIENFEINVLSEITSLEKQLFIEKKYSINSENLARLLKE